MKVFYKTSFDDGFYDYQDIGELTCPSGWTPKWLESGGGQGVLHRPEYDLKDTKLGQPEVRTGRYAANFFTVHSTHDGCLVRKFAVGAGNPVRAIVWCMNVTFDQDGSHGGHGMRIGIDPTGGEDHAGENVVYSDWWSSHMAEWKERVWKKLAVETVSQADEITVFLHAKNDYPVDISASHWDDFVLKVGEKGELPEPDQPDSLTPSELEKLIRRIVREELAKLTKE